MHHWNRLAEYVRRGEVVMGNEVEGIRRLIEEGKVQSAVEAVRDLDNSLRTTEIGLHDRTLEINLLRRQYEQLKKERDALAATCRALEGQLAQGATAKELPQLEGLSVIASAHG